MVSRKGLMLGVALAIVAVIGLGCHMLAGDGCGGCGSHSKHDGASHAEGDKEKAKDSDKAKDPVCGMEVKKSEAKTYEYEKTVEEEKGVFTCPMHPKVQQDKSGKCPTCGMDLTEKKIKEAKKVKETVYFCSDECKEKFKKDPSAYAGSGTCDCKKNMPTCKCGHCKAKPEKCDCAGGHDEKKPDGHGGHKH